MWPQIKRAITHRNLKPGTYRVKFQPSGFGAKEKADIATIQGRPFNLIFRSARPMFRLRRP